MIISFFKWVDNPAVGIDYTGHPELIHQEDVNFDPSTQIARLEWDEGNYSVVVEYKPIEEKEETRQEKYTRVYQKLLAVENLNGESDKSLLEWVEFSKKQIGDFVVDYVFDGNPHEQSSIFGKLLQWNKQPEFLAWVAQKTQKTNDVLAFFNMAGL